MSSCRSYLGTMRRPTQPRSRPLWSDTFLTGILLVIALPLVAAEHSPTLDNRIAITPKGETISVILFLDQRLTMDDVYPVARTLSMTERRAYVVQSLQERFKETSPRVMERLMLAQKEGSVTLVRPLWILNAIRVSLTEELIEEIDASFPEVYYIVNDAVYDDVLDDGWGTFEIGAPRVWNELGADGSGVIVGHKDAGLQWDHPGFAGHIWINPGEDLNGNGSIDEPEEMNGIDDDGNGYVDDFRGWNFDEDNNDVSDDPLGAGHGTKTGSVISSNFTPCDTVAVAPGAKLMVLRGYWTHGALFESSQYAILMGANVISASVSYKQTDCSVIRTCPNYVGFRWASEMELAAGIIHANSTGNNASQNEVPLCAAAPSNCPPPAMTPSHEQQGGVSSMVAVAAYAQNGALYTSSGHGPSGWSQEDICDDPRTPFCGPTGTPHEYPQPFEDYPYQQGESPGLTKPDITAPTVVASLWTAGRCASINATSGATPHVGGTLALIYSAFPGITPEEAYLVLVNGAVDAGAAGFDTLWGFGKLRAFRACSTGVESRGLLRGVVTAGASPVTAARVSIPENLPVFTDEQGEYELSVVPGTYAVTVEKFGFQDAEFEVIISAGNVTEQDADLMVAEAATLQGHVVHDGVPLSGMPVSLPEAEVTVFTDETGLYNLPDMYAGSYEFVVGALPWQEQTVNVEISPAQNQRDFSLDRSPQALVTGPDDYGYYVYDNYDAESVTFDWFEINPNLGGPGQSLNLSGDNSTVRNLPFAVQFYGQEYLTITVAANGIVLFGSTSSSEWGPYPIPRPEPPNDFAAPFFYDWVPEDGGGVFQYDDSENHRMIIEWWNVVDYFSYVRATFQVIIYEAGYPATPTGDNQIVFQYGMVNGLFDGVVGIENSSGTDGLEYVFVSSYDPHASPIDSGITLVITTNSTLEADPAPATLPEEFSLEPNYPNPFNPTTTFVWNAPRAAYTKLALYDVLGRESAVVFDGMSEAGRHELTFDASELPSGVYFARLETANRTLAVRKTLLLK